MLSKGITPSARIALALSLSFSLSLSLGACGTDPEPAPLPPGAAAEVARIEDELSHLPGDLVVTTSAQLPFSEELRERVVTAGKLVHVYADGRVAGYYGVPADAPAGVPAFRLFRELGGDIVLGNQELLPDYLLQQEPGRPGGGTAEAVGLPIGHGALWPDSTVAYEIGGGFSAGELANIRASVSSWNTALDPSGNQIRVRFVPRYWADNRPFVRFVRGGSGGCGSSQVGRHDNIFTNWWSHDIRLDCFDTATIHHEMGHTAGLYHEQQRCDRDSFVNVRSPGGINCERYCGGDAVNYGPYNYLSVMHYYYSSDAAACSIQQITPYGSYRGAPWQAGTAYALDSYDVQAINQMYTGRPSLPPIGAGRYYSLPPQYTPKVLAVPASSTANTTPIVLFDRIAGVWDQHFSLHNAGEGFVEIRPRHAPGKCLEVYNFLTSNGAGIVQWDCWGGDNQKWIVAPSPGAPGTFDIINKYSGKSLDVPGWATANGTFIQQYDHTNGSNQRFLLSPAF